MTEEVRTVLQRVGKVVLVPIQGTVTRDLLRGLRRELLAHLEHEGAGGVVLDLSGVEVLDADDFDRLRRVVDSARVMGASVILVGIQAGVAAGLVMLDADTTWVKAARTVELALRALEQS